MSSDDPAPPLWTRRYTGSVADVWMHEKCIEELEGLDKDERKKLIAIMSAMYTQMEKTSLLPPEKLKHNEGMAKAGGKERRVMAFKHHQGRVYGVEGSVNGKRVFFAATAIKKQKKRCFLATFSARSIACKKRRTR
jgi:hypothetical protein